MQVRTRTREEFLGGVFTTAIENFGYGWFDVHEYHIPEGREGEWFATISDSELDEGDKGYQVWRVDIDTIARGLGVIRRAIVATSDDGTYWHNGETFERLYFGGDERDELVKADRTNGDDGDFDVIGALAAVECALFGQVVYA